jgi:FixJ family two-component response regulator
MNESMQKIIAVVDDDERILESLEDLLESAGYEVRVHSSAIALLASGIAKIDCLITDVGMPTMGGFELRDRVRQMRPELPVILISGRRDVAAESAVHPRGYSDFFRKPFDGQTLLAAIAQAISSDP